MKISFTITFTPLFCNFVALHIAFVSKIVLVANVLYKGKLGPREIIIKLPKKWLSSCFFKT